MKSGSAQRAGLHDLVRPVHHRALAVERARRHGRPGPGGRVERPGRLVGAGVETPAVREDEHERVERRCERRAREVGPGVRLRVVDLGQRVDRRVREGREAARARSCTMLSPEKMRARPSGELRRRRVPASARTCRARACTFGRRVEERRVGRPTYGARCVRRRSASGRRRTGCAPSRRGFARTARR